MNPKELNDFKKTLEGKTVEELHTMEQDVIKEADAADAKMSKAKLKVPTKNYKEAATAIRKMLNKQTIQWQYTLGMINMYDTWDPENKPVEVPYPTLDATIRTIGALQFTGYDEWKDVVLVTEFFEPTKEEYTKIAQDVYDIADKHSAILAAIDELQKPQITDVVEPTK